MIESKENELSRETEPNGKHTAGRRSLRSFRSRIQCDIVVARYRRGKSRSARWGRLQTKAAENAVVSYVGESLYSLGFACEYGVVRVHRSVMTGLNFVGTALGAALSSTVAVAFPELAQVAKDIFEPFYVLVHGVKNVYLHRRKVGETQERGKAISNTADYLAKGISRNVYRIPRLAAYIVPTVMVAGFVVLVRTQFRRPYVLEVRVNGQIIGCIENEEVFNSARDDVLERVNYAGADGKDWTVVPTYTLTASSEVMDEGEVADAILRTASDEITEGTALYLDGELTAICKNGKELRAYLDRLLDKYKDPDDPSVEVMFTREVELVEGIYFTEGFSEYTDIVEELNGLRQERKIYTVQAGDSMSLIASKNGLTQKELYALNADINLNADSKIFPGDQLIVTKEEAVLDVRIRKTVTWEEEIPYTTEKSNSTDYAFGTVKTVQQGENGIVRYTAANIYDKNGVLLEQTILGKETIKEAVPEKIVTGTRLPNGSSAIVGNGTFIWPVPGYRYCSRWYSSGHKGVDICAAAGTPIYASASGVVSKAGYERGGVGTGYGYSILINHGNGYSTVYAHCLSLKVSVGQSVKQGQLIGLVGSTGRSTGNHCHFEIRYKGSYLAPQKYFKK